MDGEVGKWSCGAAKQEHLAILARGLCSRRKGFGRNGDELGNTLSYVRTLEKAGQTCSQQRKHVQKDCVGGYVLSSNTIGIGRDMALMATQWLNFAND